MVNKRIKMEKMINSNENPRGLNKPKASLNDRPVRIVRYDIKKEDEGMTVREYLNTRVRFSNRQISSLKFRADGIVVNGRTRRVTCILYEGDVLEIGLKDAGNEYLEPGNFTEPPEILYEDRDLLIVNKVQGMVCHPSPGHYSDTLANQAAYYAKSKNENWTIRLIGRLDSDTSGIIVFAKNSETAALLTKQREEGDMEKTYIAVCEGAVENDRGCIDARIKRDENNLGKMIISDDGKDAVTYYEVIKRGKASTLLRIRIKHGRTHQIRIHMAYAGHPLINDPFYGNGIKDKDHTMLHAETMKLCHPFTKEEMIIKAPLPDIMREYIERM